METVSQVRGVTVVELGKQYDSLDDGATRDLEAKLRELSELASPPAIVLDMTHTDGIGSTFLATLFSTVRRVRARGGHMSVCEVNPFCAEVFEIVKAERVFKIWATRAEAIADVLSHVPVPTA